MRTKMRGSRNKFQREKWTRQLSTSNFRRRENHQQQMQGLKLSDKHLKLHFIEVTSLCLFEEGDGKWDLKVLDTLNLETSQQS